MLLMIETAHIFYKLKNLSDQRSTSPARLSSIEVQFGLIFEAADAYFSRSIISAM
jgi:hypothetical protein